MRLLYLKYSILFDADVKLKGENGQLHMILAVDGDVNRLFFPFFSGSFLVKHILQVVQVSTPEGREGAAPCLLYTSPSPRDGLLSRMPSSA